MLPDERADREDFDLEVEEEEHARGIEPPAYWPSREGSVIVERLTCRYAPMVGQWRLGSSLTLARPGIAGCLVYDRTPGEDRDLWEDR